ncbi:MAG: hypothetical protein JWO31_907, partial [Phycisphaerales bacterium]|nr:hypothetical protein [Phycisphaerales bacterium]
MSQAVVPTPVVPASSVAPVGSRGGPPAARAKLARASRAGLVGVLAGSLAVAGLARQWALALQTQAYLTGPYAPVAGSGSAATGNAAATAAAVSGGPSLGSLDSYFLVLLLGGLRGPLVMFLWTSSENQKNERDLEDFDTKIELIRLLQPEFDSVHLFQMWNKAYNISAQLASLPNKYAVILDAVRYGEKVDQSRPNNLNILLGLNQLYQHKLGTTTTDSVYYRQQVRADTKWREGAAPRGVGALQQRLAPLLEKDGSLLPELVTPRNPRPAGLTTKVVLAVRELERVKAAAAKAGVALPPDQLTVPTGAAEMTISLPEPEARKLDPLLADRVDVRFVYHGWNDGSEMQYLAPYGPFPSGLSPLALGFNYGKRAQVLMNLTGQRPAQSGPSVVDSRPALELRGWMEEEWERALAAEARAYGKPVAPTRFLRTAATAQLPPGAAATGPAAGADVAEALYSFGLAHRLARDARAEFSRHMNDRTEGIRRLQDYGSHVLTLAGDELMTAGDLAYLSAAAATDPGKREALLTEAADRYRQARARYQALDLKYYIPGEAESKAFPAGFSKDALDELVAEPDKMDALHRQASEVVKKFADLDQNKGEREENAFFIDRATARMALIAAARGEAPASAPAPAATA